MSELMAVSGIDVVGPLPQDLQNITTFTGGIPTSANHADAGRALLHFLTTPAVKSVIASKGLEPT
jgi:molybdate transport system substrate-binding protein